MHEFPGVLRIQVSLERHGSDNMTNYTAAPASRGTIHRTKCWTATMVHLLRPRSLQRPVWMHEHFGIAFDALVKLFICGRRFVDANLVGDDEARLGPAGHDEVAQVAIVSLDVALASPKAQTLTSGQIRSRRTHITACSPFQRACQRRPGSGLPWPAGRERRDRRGHRARGCPGRRSAG